MALKIEQFSESGGQSVEKSTAALFPPTPAFAPDFFLQDRWLIARWSHRTRAVVLMYGAAKLAVDGYQPTPAANAKQLASSCGSS
jgi:hypothetical protein